MESASLFRTASGSTLHLWQCPHLSGTDADKRLPATERDRVRLPQCAWTKDEIAGVGRAYYPTLDAAMEALPIPVENRPRVRELVAAIPFEHMWIPSIGRYVGLGPADGPAVAYVNIGFLEIHRADGGYDRELFPNFGGGSNGSAQARNPEPPTVLCPIHHIALPASGICDDCA